MVLAAFLGALGGSAATLAWLAARRRSGSDAGYDTKRRLLEALGLRPSPEAAPLLSLLHTTQVELAVKNITRHAAMEDCPFAWHKARRHAPSLSGVCARARDISARAGGGSGLMNGNRLHQSGA